MSEEPLPPTIQADIRGLFASSNGTVHKAMTNLEKTLGHKIPPDPEWLALWNTLQHSLLTESTFVPTIACFTATWYERLLGRLENGAVHAAGTDELLKVLADSRGPIVLKIQPSNSSDRYTQPYTTWNSILGSFHLVIPPNPDTALSESRLTRILDGCFDALFSRQREGERRGSGSSPSPIRSSPPAEDGWADVDVAEEKEKSPLLRALVSENTSPNVVPKLYHLPTLDSLSSPNELFKKTSPRIMIIHNNTSLTIQCSHQPTLELIQAYLTKWAKTDTSGDTLRGPVFRCDLLESEFTFGLVDTLYIAPYEWDGRPMNPIVILALIEGVLGYRLVHTDHHKTGGTGWTYRHVEN
ncbi:hypothetical protein L218DRAFT_720061 [Marasmius fiardii PR-910]|nr:hypothetical protein L218DRAFT_720061 [Marasmius fiardii PR-910]